MSLSDPLLNKPPNEDENTFEKCLQFHVFLGKKKVKKEGKWNICLKAGERRCSDQLQLLNTPTSTYL